MSTVRRIGTAVLALGFDPRRLVTSLKFLPTFVRQALSASKLTRQSDRSFPLRWVPILSDRYMEGGTAKGHYFHQDLWAARRIYAAAPKDHIDVGSRVDGFVAHLLAFRSVKVLDVRPMRSKVDGLSFEQADLMKSIPDSFRFESVSCLHALEHFGLGRYGDPMDLDGWKKGLRNLSEMVKPGGHLYVSVPIGRQCIEFNAQRIFAPQTLVQEARGLGLDLVEFSYIDDAGDFMERTQPDAATGCRFGCGCYLFTKSVATAP